AGAAREVELRPALCWKTRVIYLKTVSPGSSISYARTWTAGRQSRIATLAVGYADGYPRILSNQSPVLIRGRRAPVVGRVTMDMTMIDVTDAPDCRVGDEVVLIGDQGTERIDALELAAASQSNAYEILCRIGERVPRQVNHG
ncbi:MAG TPA: alanine racemase C-terminal domain-containing protein, partial [Elusimicrobiota bacterium]|nr:alanine racemase C-terminal domain-containing protein [Elusimicrobiota bacterium]